MNFIDLEEGDEVQTAEVVKRYISILGGAETAVLEVPRHRDEQTVINEMAQMGWTHCFTRNVIDRMWFKASGWNMEPGAGNS